jgi:YD repeat-containing protein
VYDVFKVRSYSFTSPYDLAGQITRTVDADLETWLYTYNAAGNLTGRLDGRGCTITYGYVV